MRTAQDLGTQRLNCFAQAARRPVVGRIRGVDRIDEALFDPSPRIRSGLEDVIEALLAKPVDLRGGERRSADHLREQIESGLEALGGYVDTRRRRVPAGFGMERRAETFGGLDQGDGVIPLGALRQCAGRQDRGAGLGWFLVRCAVTQDQRSRHERAAGHLDGENGEAVRKPVALERRELVSAWCSRCGSLGDELDAHAAISSSWGISSALAASSAGGSAGT